MKSLNEKIDGSLAIKYETQNDRVYWFNVENLEYEVKFDDSGGVSSVEFSITKSDDGYYPTYDLKSVGLKKAQIVFHTVWEIIKEHLSDTNISILEFAAKISEPSRVRFYKTLSHKLAEYYGYNADDVVIEDGRYAADEVNFAVPVGNLKSLNEKIDGSLAVEYDTQEHGFYNFTIGDLYYRVTIFPDDQDDQIAVVEFEVSKKGGRHHTYDLTDVGFKVATIVFHTVWEILKKYLEDYQSRNMSIVQFSAKLFEPSRVRFYKTLAVQLAEYYGAEAEDVVIEEFHKGNSPETVFYVPIGLPSEE